MQSSAGSPEHVAVIVLARDGDVHGVEESLYSVIAQAWPHRSAQVVARPAAVEKLDRLAGNLRPLLDVRVHGGEAVETADFVAVIRAGEILYPRFTPILVAALRAHPECGVAQGTALSATGVHREGRFVALAKHRDEAEFVACATLVRAGVPIAVDSATDVDALLRRVAAQQGAVRVSDVVGETRVAAAGEPRTHPAGRPARIWLRLRARAATSLARRS